MSVKFSHGQMCRWIRLWSTYDYGQRYVYRNEQHALPLKSISHW